MTDTKTYEVKRDNKTTLRFKGQQLGCASSSPNNAHPSYSGNTGRWTELSLYKSEGGKFVCEQIGFTQWENEHTRYTGEVCATEADVIAFFGHGWLAKDLYEDAGIEDIEEID